MLSSEHTHTDRHTLTVQYIAKVICIASVRQSNSSCLPLIQCNILQNISLFVFVPYELTKAHNTVQELLFSDTPFGEVNIKVFSLHLNSAVELKTSVDWT